MKLVLKSRNRPERKENAGSKDDLNEQDECYPRKQSPLPSIWDELCFVVNEIYWSCSLEILIIRNPQIKAILLK